VDALQQQKNIDLAGIIQRIMKTKRQPQFRNNFAMGVPVKVLAASFQDEKIDMVIFELGRQLPFPQLAVVQLLKIIEKLPYPVLLTPPQTKKSREPRGPLGLVPYPKPRRKSLNRPLWTGITVAGRPKEVM